MRIVVVGPGALGCLFACRLAHKAAVDAGHETSQDEVILLDHRPERAVDLSRSGLTLHEMDGGTLRVSLPVMTWPSERPAVWPENIVSADLVLVCVKSPALTDCLSHMQALFATSPLTVFIQNGINHLSIAEGETFPMAFATTTEGANLIAQGEVRHAGRGLTSLGFLAMPGSDTPGMKQVARLATIAEYFSQAGLAAEVCADIGDRIWRKLLINVGINALTAVHDCANGALLDNPVWRDQMAELVKEARQVAIAAGAAVPTDIFDTVVDVCLATANNISSMLQDVRAGRPTEIEAINGAIVCRGARFGIATPANAEITRQVRALS